MLRRRACPGQRLAIDAVVRELGRLPEEVAEIGVAGVGAGCALEPREGVLGPPPKIADANPAPALTAAGRRGARPSVDSATLQKPARHG